MDNATWRAVEAVFDAVIEEAREGMAARRIQANHDPVMAAIFALLASARLLPTVAQKAQQDHLVSDLIALRDDVFESVLAHIGSGESVRAFRQALEQQQQDPEPPRGGQMRSQWMEDADDEGEGDE